MSNLLWFRDITRSDLPRVGGKNASLGEMVSRIHSAGVRVPNGFATTADAYRAFLAHGELSARTVPKLADLDVSDVREQAMVAARIRTWIEGQPFPAGLNDDIRSAYATLVAEQAHPDQVTWAVRSSATAEDLPDASFAGQQETFLNIDGIGNVLEAFRGVFASLYTDRALVYRAQRGFDEDDIAISAGVQLMVRSDVGASGVMFTIDTESGFDDVVFITGAYGLGETVVQGAVNPDEFYVYKPALRAARPSILRRELEPRRSRSAMRRARESATARFSPTSPPVTVRDSASLTSRWRSWRAVPSRSSPITAARWTSNGRSTVWTERCTSCRPDPRPSSPGGTAESCAATCSELVAT